MAESDPKSTPLLQVLDLNIGFQSRHGAVQAVEGVNFSLAAGEVLAIVGESGSGKSVTALALTRLGDERGLSMTMALTESEQPAIAIEALLALGQSRRPEALVPLLRNLHPELDRTAAHALLDRAGGHVKTAIVMHERGVDRDEATALLDAQDGDLRRVLEAGE